MAYYSWWKQEVMGSTPKGIFFVWRWERWGVMLKTKRKTKFVSMIRADDTYMRHIHYESLDIQ